MATSTIDLSAGLQPAPQPPPSTGGIDLSAGLQPAPPAKPIAATPAAEPGASPSMWSKVADWLDSAEDRNAQQFDAHPILKTLNDVASIPSQLNLGAFKEAGKTVSGLAHIALAPGKQMIDHPVVVNYMRDHPELTTGQAIDAVDNIPQSNPTSKMQKLKEAADWLSQQSDTEGFWQHVGGFGENIAELLTPEGLEKLGVTAPAEAGKIASMSDKLKQSQQLANFLEKNKKIAALVGIGMRSLKNAATMGTQAFVKSGGDEDEARNAAITGGVATPILEGAGALVGNVVSKIAPRVARIGSQEIPILASQEPGAGAMARNAASIDSEPAFQAAQQESGQAVHAELAQNAVRDSIKRLNATRPQPISDTGRLLAAPEDMTPYRFNLDLTDPIEKVTQSSEGRGRDIEGSGTGHGATQVPNEGFRPGGEISAEDLGAQAAATPTRSFMGNPTRTIGNWIHIPPAAGESAVSRGGGGLLMPSDPAVAQAQLSRLQDLADSKSFGDLSDRAQTQVQSAIGDLQDQLETHGRYRAGMSHFEQIDPERTAAQVGNFAEGAHQIENAVSPVYGKLDQVSNGEWGSLRKSEQAAEKVIYNPTSIDAYDRAQTRLTEIRGQQRAILNSAKEQISEPEWRAANSAWRDASTLKDIHAALQSSFNGVPEDVAQRTGIARTMKGGDPAFKRLQKLLDSRGDDVKNVIGQDGVDNLYRVANLLKSPEDANQTSALFRQVGSILRRHGTGVGAIIGGAAGHGLGGLVGHSMGGYEGALAGAGTEAVYRRIINRVATDPVIAQRVQYAVQNKVSSRVAAPIIATMILGGVKAAKDTKEKDGER